MKFELPVPTCALFSDESLEAYIDVLRDYKDHVSAVYLPLGPITKQVGNWGLRSNYGVAPPKADYDFRVRCIFHTLNEGTQVNLLLNDYCASVYHDDPEVVTARVQELTEQASIVKGELLVTVADPAVIEVGPLHRTHQFQLSVNTVRTPEELWALKLCMDQSWRRVRSLVVPRDWNRRPKLLSQVWDRLSGPAMVVMVNEGCAHSCPWRTCGDLDIEKDNARPVARLQIHGIGCNQMSIYARWMFLASPFLTRQAFELYPYDQLLKAGLRLKLAGRNLDPVHLRDILEHYVDGAPKPVASLMNIRQLPDVSSAQLGPEFWQHVTSCGQQACALGCGFCRTWLEHCRRPAEP